MTAKALLQSAGDGTAVPAGCIGEMIVGTQSAGTAAVNGSYAALTNVSLTKGIWLVSANASASLAGGISLELTVSTTSASAAGTTTGTTRVFGAMNSSAGIGGAQTVFSLNVASTTTYYLNVAVNSTGFLYGNITAIRIA